MPVSVSLGANKYGKAENRLVRITRDTARHEIEDLNVTSQLRGAKLVDSYLVGDNALVVATDQLTIPGKVTGISGEFAHELSGVFSV